MKQTLAISHSSIDDLNRPCLLFVTLTLAMQNSQHITLDLNIPASVDMQDLLVEVQQLLSSRGVITTGVRTSETAVRLPSSLNGRKMKSFPVEWEESYKAYVNQSGGKPFEFIVSDFIDDSFTYGDNYNSNHLTAFKVWLTKYGGAISTDRLDDSKQGHPRIFFYDPSKA